MDGTRSFDCYGHNVNSLYIKRIIIAYNKYTHKQADKTYAADVRLLGDLLWLFSAPLSNTNNKKTKKKRRFFSFFHLLRSLMDIDLLWFFPYYFALLRICFRLFFFFLWNFISRDDRAKSCLILSKNVYIIIYLLVSVV